MKAWILPRLGSIESLELADLPDPTPAAGEAVLRVKFAALNPADRYLAEGQYPARPTLPHVLGRDGIGVVEAVGRHAGDVKVGDVRTIVRSEVGVNRPGTFAEKVAVPTESLVTPPTGWSDEQSAAATLVYLTAWQALTQWGPLPAGATVLVTGASGGVGIASIQLAEALGYFVIGLSRSEKKRQRLLDQGADVILDPNDTQWRKKTAGRSVDLAIDNIGGSLLPDVISTLGHNGRVSLVGRLAGPTPAFNTSTLFFRRLKLGGVSVGSYTAAESRAAWNDLLAALARHDAKPIIDSTHDFDQLPAAFARLKDGPLGKVILRVGAS